MRKLLISAALLSAVAATAPAAAQRWDDRDRGYSQNQARGFDQQLDQLNQRVDRMYERRLVSRNEARNIHNRIRDIRARLYDYSRNGLSYQERDNIQRRIHDLRERLQDERREGREDRRDDRRDRW